MELEEDSRVQINKYILGHSFGIFVARHIVGLDTEGIYHTGIVVFGKEYFFGSEGIKSCSPTEFKLARLVDSIDLGITNVTKQDFEQYILAQTKIKYTNRNYSVFKNNCNDFTEETAKFLTGKGGLPRKILDQPAAVMSKPMGFLLSPVFEAVPETVKLIRFILHMLTSPWQ